MSKDTFKNYYVVESISGHHELGYPIGQILVRSLEDAKEVIKDYQIHDPKITSYPDFTNEVKDA